MMHAWSKWIVSGLAINELLVLRSAFEASSSSSSLVESRKGSLMLKKIACFAVVGLAVASTGAQAGTDTGTMSVTATISASCTIATQNINFGSLTSTNAGNVDVPADATVTCASNSPFNVGINYGLNAGATFQRKLASGANTLNYSVYVDGYGVNEYGQVSTYGTANNYNSAATINVSPATNTVPIFARLPAQSTPPSGTYTDTLTVTVNY